MADETVEITEVIETSGEKPFVTIMGSFRVIPDASVEKGRKRTDGKDAYINPEDYEEIKTGRAVDIVRAIKRYRPVGN